MFSKYKPGFFAKKISVFVSTRFLGFARNDRGGAKNALFRVA